MLIKGLVEQQGYKATIEMPTTDGKGQIALPKLFSYLHKVLLKSPPINKDSLRLLTPII